jgi:hypothetical protein
VRFARLPPWALCGVGQSIAGRADRVELGPGGRHQAVHLDCVFRGLLITGLYSAYQCLSTFRIFGRCCVQRINRADARIPSMNGAGRDQAASS